MNEIITVKAQFPVFMSVILKTDLNTIHVHYVKNHFSPAVVITTGVCVLSSLG